MTQMCRQIVKKVHKNTDEFDEGVFTDSDGEKKPVKLLKVANQALPKTNQS